MLDLIFYPIYKVDKSRAADYVKDQKSSEKNQKAEVVIVSKENEETIESVENTETHNDFDIYCEFCGKKIKSSMKICPECGSKLEA
jgi:ribosome-binding ATPase YchF (GTP1/OBG family)